MVGSFRIYNVHLKIKIFDIKANMLYYRNMTINLKKNQTFCMLKPDVTKRNIIGEVLSMLENKGLTIVKMEKKQFPLEKVREFYIDHKDKFFFNDMVNRIYDGEVVGLILEYKDENAVIFLRELMGATNPTNAVAGTIRHKYGISIDENTVHGSDSFENATREVNIFFN
jgi:nucleoside-diphosphate kinase